MVLIRHTAVAACLVWASTTFAAPADAPAFTPSLATQTHETVHAEPAAAGQWSLFSEQIYAINYGYSFSPIFDFGPQGTPLAALKAQLFVERGDICTAAVYAIDLTTSPFQTLATRYFPDATGAVALPHATVYRASVLVLQNSVMTSRCVMRLSGLATAGTDNTDNSNTNDFAMLGSVNYNGGIAQQDLPASGAKVLKFWVRIPEFCTGVELLEAGTVTEGHYEKADLIDAHKKVFSVNGGAGSRAGSIRLTLNGPRDKPCDVPVYVKSDL